MDRDKLKKIVLMIIWSMLNIKRAISSKEFLNITNDPFSLTIATFVPSLILFPILNRRFRNIDLQDFKNDFGTLVIVSLFNVGSVVLTNIGMKDTTLSYTYMNKVLFKTN